MDTIATTNANLNGGDADESGQWALREALTSAWHTAQPWIDLPPAWLDAAATALASPPPADCTDNRPEHEHTDGPQLVACQQRTVAELRRLRGETRAQTNAAARRRQELASLQSLVREQALATLSDNPRLEGPLREALSDWDLPPIPTDFTVAVSVPMTVRVTATDAEQARREAATLLAQHLRDLDHRISADTLAVDYTTVTNQ